MKNLYKKPWQISRGLQRAGITVLTLFGAMQCLDAQVSTYTFAQTSSTFNSIASTGTLVTGSDATTATTNDTTGWSVAIPFTFTFNQIGYTSMYVNSNGGVTFGTTTGNDVTVISGTSAYAGSVGVMNRDLWGVFITSGVTTSGSNVITNVASFKGIAIGKTLNNVNGIPSGATVTAFDETAGTITMSAAATSSSATAVIRYGTGRVLTSVEGTAPNRVFVVEWIGYNDYSTTAAGSNYLNFQLKLAESTNKISTVYGPQYNVSTTSRTNEIGLRGASTSDYNNRSAAAGVSWASTTAGTTSSASVARDNAVFPATGLTFTWSPPTCVQPSGIAASGITTTTASISWVASSTGAANGYEYYYGTTNTAPTSSTVPTGTSPSTSVSLSTLTPATNYYVWVRSVCSSTDKSIWSTSGTFTTACSPFTTLSENFDSFTTGSIVPTCWGRIVTGSASQTITSTTPASGTRNIFQANSTAGNISIVLLPELSTVNAGYQLRFKVRATAAATLDIGYLTNPTDATTFVNVQTLSIANTTYGAESKIPFPTSVPATARVAVRMPVQASAPSIYWDDVNWEIAPSCVEPNTVTVSAITPTSATLAWVAPSTVPANGYEYYYSTSNTAPTATTIATGSSTTTTAPLTGLAPATTYYVWVRSVCSTTSKSLWTAVTTFASSCNPVTTFPWSENFDAMTTIGNGILPNCWSTTGGLSASYFFTTQNAASQTYNDPRSAPNYVTIYYPTTAAYLWAPAMTLTAGQSYDFSFYWAGDATAGWVGDVLVNNAASATGATNLSNFVSQTTTTSNAYTKVTVTFVPTTTGIYYFGVKAFSATSAPYYMGFDDFSVQLTPSCAEPTAASVSAITSTTATLSWTAPVAAPANGYQYFYSTTNTTPTTGTAITGTTINIPALTPATTYYYWVRSVCSGSSTSTWVTGSFTTLAVPPTNDACSGATALTPGATFSQNAVTSTNAGATTDISASCAASSAVNNIWFSVVVPASGSITVETGAAAGSPFTDSVLTLFSGACGSLTAIDCNDDIASGSNIFSRVTLTGRTPGEVIYASVYRYSTAGSNGQIQISAYDASLSTAEVSQVKNNLNVYPNPFADVLNISDVKNVKSVSVVDIAGRLVKTIDKPSSALQLGDLKSGMYVVVLNMNDGSKQTIKAIKK
ncbi:fibronectin type III domain-containing protein [Chryseobacterium wangxinyae]|uniref:fibronectin type III domain-containing protein n=1 Tax=Chryseobacterium sp. CY350 TaxID=2997336 RepID=UPI002270E433|nr:fibronectin type III domain-containing protein [Chryseobacterium sp. CY350]MCY0977580.1 fibronectin type III domain-containing protein [Chryseobacterium sp. CY350]WBZ95410.1 fibronectin type III domain-containing protein [Chryseobacterium sp. CY350]